MTIGAVAVGAVLIGAPVSAVDGTGNVSVGDGDSLKVAGESIRLHGIDAPELAQDCINSKGQTWSCGRWARNQLRDIIAGNPLSCVRRDTDRFGRTVATCTSGGRDLGAMMVERGAAVAFTRYSMEYTGQERAAKAAKRGLWSGTFQRPEDFRAQSKVPEVAVANTTAGCAIKGNISGGGNIYHMPGQHDYDAVRIDPKKGEQWFCTETEARAAGWRKARR